MTTLPYAQETIPVAYQNVQWNGYTGPNAGGCGQHTWFPTAGTSRYPFPNFVPDAHVNPLTFYAGDGDSNCIGIETGDPYKINALQGGSTIGISLCPRAVDPNMGSPVYLSCLANYWFCGPNFVRPWNGGLGLRMCANIVFPFCYVPHVGQGRVDQQGIVFSYFVANLSDVAQPSRQIYICPRLLQNQYSVASEAGSGFEWDFGAGDQISFDDVDDVAILFPECKPGSAWITSNGTGAFNIGSDPYWRKYQWSMSAAQLQAGISAINASPRSAHHDYSTDVTRWQLRLINLNCETWAMANTDPRLALSFNGFKCWQL